MEDTFIYVVKCAQDPLLGPELLAFANKALTSESVEFLLRCAAFEESAKLEMLNIEPLSPIRLSSPPVSPRAGPLSPVGRPISSGSTPRSMTRSKFRIITIFIFLLSYPDSNRCIVHSVRIATIPNLHSCFPIPNHSKLRLSRTIINYY